MLAMTQNAVAAVEQIVGRKGMPASAVVRIAAGEHRANDAGPGREVQIEVMPRPSTRDLVVQEMRLAVEPRSLAYLDDKVLDARVADGEVEFQLYPQPTA